MLSFSLFQYGFRWSRSTADLLTVSTNRIAKFFNKYGATWVVALDISKDFDRVWHAAFYHKLRFYGGWGHIFGLILPFSSNRRLLTIFLLHINDLADIICNIATMVMILLYTLRKGRCKTASSQLCVC